MAQKMTISVCKGRGSITHNNRDFIAENVDKDRVKDNKIYIQQPLEKAYDELFGAELKRYNQGKKPCRQIKNYMEHIENSKNGEKVFYETVVQIGNMQDMKNDASREKAIKILDEYAKDFQKRNPNLHVFNMVMHLDEASPHLHIDYIPIAHGYKQGLQVRNSLDKAFKEQGIDGKANKKENSTQNWQEQQKNEIEKIMVRNGLERAPEQGVGRKKLTVDQYKAVVEVAKNEGRKLPKQIETAPYAFNKERVSVAIKDLEKLEKRAKISLVCEKANREIQNELTKKINEVSKDKAEIEKIKVSLVEKDVSLEKQKQEYEKAKKEYEQALRSLPYEFDALKEENQTLYEENQRLSLTISNYERSVKELKVEIQELKASIELKVKNAVSTAVKDLKEKLENATDTTLAVGRAMAYIKKNFKIDEKTKDLCSSVQEYAKYWLKNDGFEHKSKAVEEPIISKGIEEYWDKTDTRRAEKTEVFVPNKLLFKGGLKGQGFYDENGKYFGDKSKLKEFKEMGIAIKDPYDLLNKNK